MADQPVVNAQVPSVTVGSGDRVSTVPTWPMALAGVNRRAVELEAAEGDVLVLGPKRGSRWNGVFLALTILIPGLVGVGLTMSRFYEEGTTAGLVFFGVGCFLILGLLGLAFLSWMSRGVWVRFDRQAGLISHSRRPFGFLRAPRVYQTVPMTNVICLQLIYNGFHSDEYEIGDGDRKTYRTDQYHAYQMNLVLEREGQFRMNLAHHSDWEWMRRAGGQLAEYLKVPLVDQLHHD
jgi:hypothetical protein